jgi:ABC-type transport system involved in multi-copper enzyme maturation permease subunit
MIINAAYEGPPYGTALGACSSCQTKPQLGNTSPIAGLSYTTVGALVLTALTVAAVGITLWSFKPKNGALKGRRRR